MSLIRNFDGLKDDSSVVRVKVVLSFIFPVLDVDPARKTFEVQDSSSGQRLGFVNIDFGS